MKTLYLECTMGAAGDMLLSALYELLEDQAQFLKTMNGLGLPGVTLEATAADTCGIAGTHIRVLVDGREELDAPQGNDDPPHVHNHTQHGASGVHGHSHPHDHGHDAHHHATPGHIGEIIQTLSLPEEVKQHARAVYDAIAQAEAKAHGRPVGDIHFHEVGALDAIADVTGVCYAIFLLQPDQILVSPVHVGSGTVRCQHGVMPVPAPATAALLTGIPIYGGAVQGELCTPTGAALLAHFASSFGPMPMMVPEQVGVGIGTKSFAQANCVRAFWGRTEQEANGEICELTCNIDDMTPEALAYAASRLLEMGALDVYTIPGLMKKGRPGYLLTVLCTVEKEAETARQILAQTTTNGLRARRCGKYFLTPGMTQVMTKWGPVRVKTASGFGLTHQKPEYEDVAALANASGLPYQTVLEDVLRHIYGENRGKE